jgi:hypothetical protein
VPSPRAAVGYMQPTTPVAAGLPDLMHTAPLALAQVVMGHLPRGIVKETSMDIEHTQPRAAPTPSRLGGLAQLARMLLRLALGLVGFVLLLGALMVGLVLALGIVIWARLRGRKAAPGVFTAAFHKARRRPAAFTGDVVDVQVREVPDVPSPNPSHKP